MLKYLVERGYKPSKRSAGFALNWGDTSVLKYLVENNDTFKIWNSDEERNKYLSSIIYNCNFNHAFTERERQAKKHMHHGITKYVLELIGDEDPDWIKEMDKR